MVHSSDNTSDWVCASIVTHLLREQSNRGGGRVCHHRQEALMYKQSHNNNDIESMIFVLHIEGRIFCNCFWYFLFLHYLQFSQGAALGHLRTMSCSSTSKFATIWFHLPVNLTILSHFHWWNVPALQVGHWCISTFIS